MKEIYEITGKNINIYKSRSTQTKESELQITVHPGNTALAIRATKTMYVLFTGQAGRPAETAATVTAFLCLAL